MIYSHLISLHCPSGKACTSKNVEMHGIGPHLIVSDSLSDSANLRVLQALERALWRVGGVVEPLLSRRAKGSHSGLLFIGLQDDWCWSSVSLLSKTRINCSWSFFPKCSSNDTITLRLQFRQMVYKGWKRQLFVLCFPSWLGSCFWLYPLTPCQSFCYNLAVPHSLPDQGQDTSLLSWFCQGF